MFLPINNLAIRKVVKTIMHSKARMLIMFVVASLIASLVTFVSSGVAAAAEIADLKWPAVAAGYNSQFTFSDPKGGVTLGCDSSSNSGSNGNLRTYSGSGQAVRDIPRTTSDGANCIWRPAVDKNGDMYGYSEDQGDLLAYSGNTQKWRYDTTCSPSPTVGADGNIYIAAESNRLIALSPTVAPGKTQPTKVRDVAFDAPISCGTEFRAFTQGLWTSGDGRTFLFFSYGGKKLAEFTTARRPIPNAVNANGLLFYSNGNNVAAFDPITNTQKWSVSLSAFGRSTASVDDVYATSDGGVVVRTTGTNPEFIKLTASGSYVTERWSQTFPSVDNDGNSFGYIYAIPNGHGKLALFRSAKLKTSDAATTVPAVGIAVLDAMNGEVSYSKTLQGNLDAANGNVFGYQMEGDPSRGLAIGVDTVYVRAKCEGTCTDTASKLFPIKVPGMRLDYPRGAVLTANASMQPDASAYVAMGDSFSSGQGAGVYDADTVTSTNKCHKSNYAFGRILNRNPSSPLMLTGLAACGGAVIDNIDTNTTYPGVAQKQDQVLSSNTKIVSLTIGGNDIDFTGVVTTCVKASMGLGDCNAAITSARQKLRNLPTNLSRIYADILSKTSSQNGGANAQIYVLGYAPLLSTDTPDCIVNDFPFGGDDKAAAIQLLNDLNKVISNAVGVVNNSRIQYVDPLGANSPFIGHSLCANEPYFNGIRVPNTSESFHPNSKGQKAYADLLSQYVLAS